MHWNKKLVYNLHSEMQVALTRTVHKTEEKITTVNSHI